MFKKYIDKLVDKRLEEILNPNKPITGDGFFSAAQLRGVTVQWKIVPYGNYYMPVKLKTLHAGEMPSVTLRERADKCVSEPSHENTAWLLNTMEKYCKAAMLCPTYEQAKNIICQETDRDEEEEKKILETEYLALKHINDPKKRAAKEAELKELSMATGMFLPLNTMNAISSWCECLDITQVKDITDDVLEQAAAQAKRFGGQPSDYIGGVFTTQNRAELNIASERVYNNRRNKKE